MLLDKYFDRPAKELILLTPSDHHKIHKRKIKKTKYITVDIKNTTLIYDNADIANILVPYLYKDYNVTRDDIKINIVKD